MHQYEKRSSSPNLSPQVYQKKIAAQQANTSEEERVETGQIDREGMLQLRSMMARKMMQMQATLQQTDGEAASTNVVATEKQQEESEVQLKCNDCTAGDRTRVPESQLQEDSSSSAKEVQLAADGKKSSASKIQQVAATGFSGSSTSLPHQNQIQESFGVDLSGVQAYIGGEAAAACQQIGAQAYASGNQIAFKEQPSPELAAHEAAHVVQQASGKVQLAGGVGKVGDEYENHADAVAAKVVAGESAAQMLADFLEQKTDSGERQSQEKSPTDKNSTSSHLDRTIAKSSNKAEEWVKLGFSLSQKGEYEAALKYYEKAIQSDPNYSQVWYNRGVVLLKLNRLQEALDSNQKALRIDTNWGTAQASLAWNNIGVIYYRWGWLNEALQYFQRAVALNPGDQLLQNNLKIVEAKLSANPSLKNRNNTNNNDVGIVGSPLERSSQQPTETQNAQPLTPVQQLEAFSPAIKTLLGGQENFQPKDYRQLLRVGKKLQELPPAEFEYIYQPLLINNLAGNLTRLESSINIFTNTRRLVIAEYQTRGGSYSQQKINDSLFGEDPITSNPSWQQVLKDLITSVLQSPLYAGDVLGEVFDFFKEHWISFIALTVALIGAQALVTVLTSIPEPTFLTKVMAVSLQGLILTVFGVGILVSLENAIGELMNWWNAASTANGNPEQIASASRSFLRMVGNLILLIISSKQFQEQLKPEQLGRLKKMLSYRQQRLSRLPDAYEGMTVELVPDPANPNSYVYNKLPPKPNVPQLPPPSRPSVDDLTNKTPPAPKPSNGGGSGVSPTRPPSIPSTLPTTPEQLTPPTSTGQTANPGPILPQQVQQPQVPNTSLPPVTTGGELTPSASSSPVTNPNQTTFADPPQPPNIGISPLPTVTDGQLVDPSSQSDARSRVQTPVPDAPRTLPITGIPLTTEKDKRNERPTRQVSIINALGEVHEFKIFPDGTIIRCSDPCAGLEESIHLQLKELLLHPTDDTIRSEADKILQSANRLAQQSKANVNNEDPTITNDIFDELCTLDNRIIELKDSVSQPQNPKSSSVVNIEAMRVTLGKEVFELALLHRGDGLQKLQELMGVRSREEIKALLDNGLGVKRLIDVIAENSVLYVKLILEITQQAETSGVITKRIETAVELLKMSPSEALEVLRVIQQDQKNRLAEQGARFIRSEREVKSYNKRPPNLQNQQELGRLQTLNEQEGEKAKALRNISKDINNAVDRIDTITNPRKWAQLPCFADETPVWTVEGVKRIDELHPGEKVWAFDEELQQTVQRKVLKVLQNRTVHFYNIQVGSSTIQATGNHPFWVEDSSEWIAAGNLKAGMKLKHLNGQIIPIESINLKEGAHSNTYNLSIDKTHNYFVGVGVLVHNEGVVNYNLGGDNYQIYIGKNSQYPQKIYVGITKETLSGRLGGHHNESRIEIKIIEAIPEAQRTSKQIADLEFYKFKLGILNLNLQAQGIKTKEMAEYIEENLARFYEQEGQLEVTNREGGRRRPATMDSRAREIADDADVQKQGYCN